MFVCCECCMLSGKGLCDGLITRPGEVLPTVAHRKTMRKQTKLNQVEPPGDT
jgi:hypothetical protein